MLSYVIAVVVAVAVGGGVFVTLADVPRRKFWSVVFCSVPWVVAVWVLMYRPSLAGAWVAGMVGGIGVGFPLTQALMRSRR